MSHNFPPPPILKSIFTFICILIAFPGSDGDDEMFETCQRRKTCGRLQDIKYPFWANNTTPEYCGRQDFELICEDNQFPILEIRNQRFRVLAINDTHPIMRMARDDYIEEPEKCPVSFQETSITNQNLFNYRENVRNLSFFFDCSAALSYPDKNIFSCPSPSEGVGFYTIDGDSQLKNITNSCRKSIKVPIILNDDGLNKLLDGGWKDVLNGGFEVVYDADMRACSDCSSSKGICGSNDSTDGFLCFCRDHQPNIRACPAPGPAPAPGDDGSSIILQLGLGLGAGISSMTISCLIIICIFKRKKISLILRCRKIPKNDQDLEAFIRNYGPLALNRYSFSNVKKLTNSFKHELGQGGYGSVYKGKLSDGRIVAVKLLKTTKGNGQEFINEVASISRTSHVNVVSLLGFCLEGSNRALIYEFMPNGSLDKFIYDGSDTSKPSSSQHLGWDKMYQIVIGIAKGLEYLHRGCSTRILHFDIKPHNILLDEDFCPKISDFGMAKLCLKKESIVSMMEARGTIGYIAPEVFSRNFGQVSHKSDIYSYGMMILELAGFKNKQNSGADRSSEIYFPHWIYKHFERDYEFKVPGIESSEENEIAKRMIVVGLWCIQSRPSDRPSINRVIEMLQNSTEALEIPPKPFASSPSRPPIDSSAISTP